VNDHVDLALAVDADGVHLGQKDLPVAVVRRLVPPDMMVGCSTNNPDEARRAEADGADYVSVGRLFPTGSKGDTRPATLETLRAVKAAVSVPVCAIGGITEQNIDEAIAAGADMVSVIGAVTGADDVREAARRLAGRFECEEQGRATRSGPQSIDNCRNLVRSGREGRTSTIPRNTEARNDAVRLHCSCSGRILILIAPGDESGPSLPGATVRSPSRMGLCNRTGRHLCREPGQ
jgi:hypothetical protein